MFSIENPVQIGGLLALLTLFHFVADWILQSDTTAVAKFINPWALTRHAVEYTIGMGCLIGVFLGRLPMPAPWYIVALIFTSHWIEDTYVPVYLWAKYLRCTPELQAGYHSQDGHLPDGERRHFIVFASTPLGKILTITIDQTVHIAFLVPVAMMIARPEMAQKIWIFGQSVVGVLALIVLWGTSQIKKPHN
jgi:hypothetical protein